MGSAAPTQPSGGGASPNLQHPKLLQVAGSPPKIFILRGGTPGKAIHSAESFEEGSGEPPPSPLHPCPHRSAREGGRRGGVPAVPRPPPQAEIWVGFGVTPLGLSPGAPSWPRAPRRHRLRALGLGKASSFFGGGHSGDGAPPPHPAPPSGLGWVETSKPQKGVFILQGGAGLVAPHSSRWPPTSLEGKKCWVLSSSQHGRDARRAPGAQNSSEPPHASPEKRRIWGGNVRRGEKASRRRHIPVHSLVCAHEPPEHPHPASPPRLTETKKKGF